MESRYPSNIGKAPSAFLVNFPAQSTEHIRHSTQHTTDSTHSTQLTQRLNTLSTQTQE